MSSEETKGEDFEVFTEVMDLWKWSFRNVGALIRVSWLSLVLTGALMAGALYMLFDTLFEGVWSGGGKGKPAADLDVFADLFTTPTLFYLLAGYAAFLVLTIFINAIPTGGATRMALDPAFKKSFGIGYLRFGRAEFRIGLLLTILVLLSYGGQGLVQYWLFRDVFHLLSEMWNSGGELDPEVLQRLTEVEAMTNAVSMLALLVAGYVYARLLPAIPIIVEGGKGLGVRAALRMTRGHGMVLFGAVVLAFVFLFAGIFGLMIAGMIVAFLLAALVSLLSDVLLLIIVPLLILLFFAISGIYIGYFQRLQVRAYEWLSQRTES